MFIKLKLKLQNKYSKILEYYSLIYTEISLDQFEEFKKASEYSKI